jgi:hypothetical protein
MINIWITGSSEAPSLARQHCQRPGDRLIQGSGDFLLGAGKHPTKTHTANHGSNTHATPALAVGGKLTKRVLGSFACLGDFSMLRGREERSVPVMTSSRHGEGAE